MPATCRILRPTRPAPFSRRRSPRLSERRLSPHLSARLVAAPAAVLAALLLPAWLAAQPAGPPAPAPADSLVPVDEAGRDPELLTFRARLLRALAEGDVDAAAALADPGIELSFGGDAGRESFREMLEDPVYRGELAAVLGLGGVFTGDDTFVAPYTFVRWPGGYEVFGCYAVIAEDVRVRAAPDLDAEIVTLVGYEPVCGTRSELPVPEGWVAVGLEDGGTGYMAERFLRSPVDFRAVFRKKDGHWWIVVFIAGD